MTRITNQIIWRCCVENITIAIIIIIIIISITYVVSSNIDWNCLLIPNFLEYLEVICWLNIFCLILVWFNQKLDIFWLRLLHVIFENTSFICGMISLKILNCYKFFVYTFVTDVIFCRCASSAVSNRWIKRIRSQSFFLGACKFSTHFIWRICNYHLLNKKFNIIDLPLSLISSIRPKLYK